MGTGNCIPLYESLTAQGPSREVRRAKIEAAFSSPSFASQHRGLQHGRGIFLFLTKVPSVSSVAV